ncbi:Highly acidic protein [hydrothermal vent metagenome]|uniref:Highly acidic protein n=1 Tax=hydrothermal vent metagenome TaxID=652676 RepID=A0A1W1CE62_9ZZZZ
MDEVQSVGEIGPENTYDLFFVDDASCTGSVKEFIDSRKTGRTVFLSYDDAAVPGFDITLKKPFLPSQILVLMESVDIVREPEKETKEPVIFPPEEETLSAEETEDSVPTETLSAPVFPLTEEPSVLKENLLEIEQESSRILDRREIEKIKDLLDMDEEEMPSFEEEVAEEILEQRKVDAITAQLISEGLEIVDEKEIVEALHSDSKSKKKKKREDTGPFNPKEFEVLQKQFLKALFKLKPKKIKKLLKGKNVKITLKLKGGN